MLGAGYNPVATAAVKQRLSRKAQSRRISPTLVGNLFQVLDPVAVAVVGILVYVVYVNSKGNILESQYFATIFMGVFLASLLFHWFDAYADDCLFSRRLPIRRLLSGWAVAFAILLATAFALKISSSFSRIWVVTWFFGTASALIGCRLFLSHWIFQRIREGSITDCSVIIGAGVCGQRFAAHLKQIDDPRTNLLGFIDDRNSRVPVSDSGYDILGDMRHLLNMIRANMVDQVFIALPWNASERLASLVHQLALTPVRVCLVTEPLDFEFPNTTIKYSDKVPILQLFDRPLSGWSYMTKMIEDRLIAALILIFIAPLMIVIALAIKLDSPGPVFFRQRRYGFNNDLIAIWKFRTMYADRLDPGGAIQATRNDPRVTRLGRFLRKSSLDELPQFINVMLGNMSIVGPRPHPVELTSGGRQFEETVKRYAARHRVKPGITGWAQVNGWRGTTDTVEKIRKRVEHDLYYIDNWSIWFDFLIIIKTVFLILKDDDAY
ncbi:MAG: undecaprenyl-phosphate glucose phosphotransferase [Paracoccaceae bacterium]|nr:undecaprenyl-phosphate glucose phosphotransferase [Candidatus Poribacteria bacterium]